MGDYDGGLFVDSTVVPGGAKVARLEPLTSALITEVIASNPTASYAIEFDAPTSIISDGMSMTGDELRLVPTNGGGVVDGIVRVDVTAAGIPSLTVTNETGTPIPEPGFLLGLSVGLMMLALLPRRSGAS